ncbi:hypothetical protein GCM10023085_34080 [Actinomadura viridis]|uniref:Tfp pilus assembly protein FimV n=1 Tax=Actinomadura viridis TaxID=58110 RepID=A0A931GIH8_9ACTN|nr:hypothetical protein [Actinomadura viridis]MBG6088052.1 Tfp pilus assembly protein FimV [Actinomadura viridis]
MRERGRRAAAWTPPLLAFLLCLLGLIYEPGSPAVRALPTAAAPAGPSVSVMPSGPSQETSHPAFIANHAQAAAPGDHPGPLLALQPGEVTLSVPHARLPRPGASQPACAGAHADAPQARAPPPPREFLTSPSPF